MANAAALIRESLWRDADWRKLSRNAQALYLQLLSQKELDCAGVLPYQPHKWAKGCAELTVAQVLTDLEELQNSRFVFYDEDTDETFIRTYIRNSNVMKVPNMRKSARRAAALVASPLIKLILAQELRATGDPECIATADQINPSGTVPEPLANPSEFNPYGTLPEGSGVGTGKGVTHLGNNSRGVSRPICAKHKNGNTDDENCRGCMKQRQWEEKQAAQAEQDEIQARLAAREIAENCEICHGTNWLPDTEPAERCTHMAVAHA
jgi:hypothetical protein